MTLKYSWGAPSSSVGIPDYTQAGGFNSPDLALDSTKFSAPLTDWAASAAPNYGKATSMFGQKGFVPGNPAEPMSMFDKVTGAIENSIGTPQNPGWASGLMGVGQGMFNAWMGMQQYGLAKDKLAESKRQYAANYEAQRTTTNSALEDRQRARVASNAGAYESVGSYMDKHSVKGLA